MTEIPPNVVTQADLDEWFRLTEELKKVKAKEMLLRLKIFKGYFPAPREGTNKAPLADGYQLTGTHVVNRDVDEGALSVLGKDFTAAGLRPDLLIKWKPSLVKSGYNTLTDEQKHLFDQALIVKPGSPSLEITKPKKVVKT